MLSEDQARLLGLRIHQIDRHFKALHKGDDDFAIEIEFKYDEQKTRDQTGTTDRGSTDARMAVDGSASVLSLPTRVTTERREHSNLFRVDTCDVDP